MAELGFPAPPLADGFVSLRPWHEADVPGKLLAFSDPVVHGSPGRVVPGTPKLMHVSSSPNRNGPGCAARN